MKITSFILDINDLYNYDFNFLLNYCPFYRQERVQRMKIASSRNLSLGAGILLKHALALYGVDIDKSDSISHNSYGKPYLNDNSIFFNLSHSENYVLCSISEAEVGCDIQRISWDKDFSKLSKRFYTLAENNLIFSKLSEEEQIYDFYRIWSAKESYIKAIGKGLSVDLKSFNVNLPTVVGDIFFIEDYYNKEYPFSHDYTICVSSSIHDFDERIKKIFVSDIIK